MRLIFMGTPVFAQTVLEALITSHHRVVGVYSQPPRPSGRGHRLQKSPVHARALDAGLEVFTPQSLKSEEEQKKIFDLRPDAIIVAAYGLILPSGVLGLPPYGCLNIHTSLLPRWRGAAPIQRSILAGDTQTGVTIMQMDKGLDTGDILLQEKIPITPHTTATALDNSLALIGSRLCLEALKHAEENKLEPRPQPEIGITYAEKLTKADGLLDWAQTADFLDRQIRALTPWPGTYFIRDEQRYSVKKAQVISEVTIGQGQKPGTVLDDQLTIQCGEGALRLLHLQKPGRAVMTARDFLNGTPIKTGSLIGNISQQKS